jgi:hypothetical protein
MTGDEADPESLIHETRRRVHQTRRLYYSRSIDGDAGTDLHLELAKRVLEYDDVLSEFKSMPGVDRSDFPDVSAVKERLGRKTEVTKDAPGRSRGKTTEKVPAVIEIPPNDLVAMTERLDEIAQDLGFGADLDADQPGGIR